MSMGCPRQEDWSRLPFPSPGELPHPGIYPRCPALQADPLLSEPHGLSEESLLEGLFWLGMTLEPSLVTELNQK